MALFWLVLITSVGQCAVDRSRRSLIKQGDAAGLLHCLFEAVMTTTLAISLP